MNKYKLLVLAVVMMVVGGFYFHPVRVHASSQWDYDTDCGDSTDTDVTGCSPNQLGDLPDSLVPIQNTAGNYTTPINITLNGGAPGSFSPSYQLWKIKKLGHYVAYTKHPWQKDQVVLKSCQTNIPNYKPLQWAISSESSDWKGYYMKGSPTVLGGMPADLTHPLDCGNPRTAIFPNATHLGAYASDGSSYGPMSNKTVSDSDHHVQSFKMDFCSYGTVNVNVKTDGNSGLPTGYVPYSVAGPFGIELPISNTTKTVDNATKSWTDARLGSYTLTGAAPSGYTATITPSGAQSISCATGQSIAFTLDFTSTAAVSCGTSPGTCVPSTTSASADNGLTACGTTHTWNCGTVPCSHTNAVCGNNVDGACALTPTTQNGAVYYGAASAWDARPFCSAGTVFSHSTLGTPPDFPALNSQLSWECHGSGTGTNETNCNASHLPDAATSGTLTGANCTIPRGSSTCPTTLTLSVTNPVSGAATNITKFDRVIVATGIAPASKSNIVVAYPNTTFYLNHNSQTIATKVVNATCASGDEWSNNACREIVGGSTSPSGTLTAKDCTIAINRSTCNDTNVTWTTANLTGGDTAVTRNNPDYSKVAPPVSPTTSGTNVKNTVNYGQSTFYLYHNINGVPTLLAEKTINASCGTNVWDTHQCIKASTTLQPPTGVRAVPGTCGINISWTASSSSNVDIYNIYRRTAGTDIYALAGHVKDPAVAFHDLKAEPTKPKETLYYYVVRAKNTSSGEESANSNEASSVANKTCIIEAGRCAEKHYGCLDLIGPPHSTNAAIEQNLNGIVNGEPAWTWKCPSINKDPTSCFELKRIIPEN